MTPLVEALAHHQAGRLAEAASRYRDVLAAEPRNPDALYLLGILARQAQQPETAIELIRQAIGLRDGVAQFHHHLGAAFLDAGDKESARKAFIRALQLDPRYVDSLLSLANLLAETGDNEAALTCFTAALRLRPGDANVALRVALLQQKPAEKPTEASRAPAKATRRAPRKRTPAKAP